MPWDMSKVVKKVLNISLEYSDLSEVEMALYKLQDALKSGKTYDRVTYQSSIIEWSTIKVADMDYTEQVINGQWCRVYQSKINKSK
jgi:hypothetical protein